MCAVVACGGGAGGAVEPVPEGPVCNTPLCDRAALDALGVDLFYRKYVDASGIPVIGSEKVEDRALLVAKEIVEEMLAHREDVHAAMETRGAYVGPTIHDELQELYDAALGQSLWSDTYAAANRGEYWAEGVQSWFDVNQDPQEGVHNHVDTRTELKDYDPLLAALIERFLGDGSWRPGCPAG